LFGVKAAEMLPDDFLFAIALYFLSAGIPIRYDSVRVEHEDCIIADALNENLEASFCAQPRFGFFLQLSISGDQLSRSLLDPALELLLVFAKDVLDVYASADLFLGGAIQGRLLDGNRRLNRDGADDAFRPCIELARFRMAEK